jgi:hypothetical protein
MILIGIASAQADSFKWIDDFNYANVQQLQDSGWTIQRPAGISFSSGALVLDAVDTDVSVHYSNRFPTGIYDWKVETKSMWLGQGHSVLSAFIATERHGYGFACDGYYNEFSLYRDSQKILHFGHYQEQSGAWVTLTMTKEGNTISMFFNGELKNTYTEEDTQPSQVIGVDVVGPWRGDAKYDYIMAGSPDAVYSSSDGQPLVTSDESGLPLSTVLVGGGIAAIAVGGVVFYYFFFAGGHAGASAGSTAGSGTGGGGSSGTGEEGEGSVIEEQPPTPLGGQTPIIPPSYPNLSSQTKPDVNAIAGCSFNADPNGIHAAEHIPNQVPPTIPDLSDITGDDFGKPRNVKITKNQSNPETSESK